MIRFILLSFLFVLVSPEINALQYEAKNLGRVEDNNIRLLSNGTAVFLEYSEYDEELEREGKGEIFIQSNEGEKKRIEGIDSVEAIFRVSDEGHILGKYKNDDLFLYSPKEGVVNLSKEAMKKPYISELLKERTEEFKARNDYWGSDEEVLVKPDFMGSGDEEKYMNPNRYNWYNPPELLWLNNKGQVAGVVEDRIFFYDLKKGFQLFDINKSSPDARDPYVVGLNDDGQAIIGANICTRYEASDESDSYCEESKLNFFLLDPENGISDLGDLGIPQYLEQLTGVKDNLSTRDLINMTLSETGVIYGTLDLAFTKYFPKEEYDWDLTTSVVSIFPEGDIYISGYTEYLEKKTHPPFDTLKWYEDPPLFFASHPILSSNNELIFWGGSLNFFKVNENRDIVSEIKTPSSLIFKDTRFEEPRFDYPIIYSFNISKDGKIQVVGTSEVFVTDEDYVEVEGEKYRINEESFMRFFLWNEKEGVLHLLDLMPQKWAENNRNKSWDEGFAQINDKGDILLMKGDNGSAVLFSPLSTDNP